ncbi:RNA polymerase sigma factor [Reichenbachiella versicolor]|uniref:RNA polymerase sigma factor n=1 Tax=Reichenbachiella versicolor TaxID=1821036 RepID=UPI000D6E4AEF|nr:RNA polymerase sigma factor [Reichenbachiella versicolor]
MTKDESLIEAIARQENSALAILYERYSKKVYNTAISYLQNAEDAEEVTQDVFTTIYQKASKYRGEAKVSTWIYRVTVNKSLDMIRRKNSEKRKGFFVSLYKKDSGDLAYDQSTFDHPGVKLEHKENAQQLFKVINELPDKQKSVFILTQVEGLPQVEVAEILNTTRKAVESVLARAKQNLRKKLEKYYPNRGDNN